MSNQSTYLFLGLAGEGRPQAVVHSGLFRLEEGSGEWRALQRGLPELPAVRALAVHPVDPAIIYAGTQLGPYRSADAGEHWEKVQLPDHGLPIWSILFHPHNPDVILIGSENAEIYRSDDAGERWRRLPVSVRFPDITTGPSATANWAKRVLTIDVGAGAPDHLYAALEVGGIIRSTDGGEHWKSLSHGHYVNDDTVDMHAVLASRWRPDTIFAAARAGLFRSADGGDHWSHVPLKPLNAKGQIYCRDIREVPGNPQHLWLAAGASLRSDLGMLLRSRDGGDTWTEVDVGGPVPHTMFKLAFDEHRRGLMSCATNRGEVWSSRDAGETWTALPPLPGETQIYALARG